LGVLHSIKSVSQCVDLHDLRLLHNNHDGWHCLRKVEWAAVAQLTCLTCLHVGVDTDCDDDAAAFHRVLGQLKQLQCVGAYMWASRSLPVLQSLTHVTAVDGGWHRNSSSNAAGLTCPHIKGFDTDRWDDDVPFEAFPNLSRVTARCLKVDRLLALCHNCTSLQTLQIAHGMSFEDSTSSTSALSALARLPHLTHLAFIASGVQLSAFISAYVKGGCLQLQSLRVCEDFDMCPPQPLTVFDLWSLQLLGLRGLTELSVRFTSCDASFTVQAVSAWLVGLAVVPQVSLWLCSDRQLDVVEAAEEFATSSGLPLPATLDVYVT
jgi:hypothetical protein